MLNDSSSIDNNNEVTPNNFLLVRVLVKHIPINNHMSFLLHDIIQTQDIFYIRFQPEYSEADISIYEFRNYDDIYCEVKKELSKLGLTKILKNEILCNLQKYSMEIEENILYFGTAHIFG